MNWKKAYSLNDALENPGETMELYIHKRPMTVFPVAIFQLKELRKLEISACQLRSIPENIGDLKKLEILVLSDNQLETLPEGISKLTKLLELDLSNNAFDKFPREVLALKKLERLLLQKNKIRTIPKTIARLKQLKKLNASSNKLRQIPPALTSLDKLESLRLSSNFLKGLPEKIGSLKHLKKLYLDRNKIIELPGSMGECEALFALDLSRNKLNELPDALMQCHSLVKLLAAKNNLSSIPNRVDRLRQIQELDLRENKIELLSGSIGACQHLEQLQLSKNKIQNLPSSITLLKALTSLQLSNNQLKTLPSDLHQLKKLQHLDINRNPIEAFPETLLQMPWLAKLLLPASLKKYRGLPAFFKKCIKAALPEKYYHLFYQLTMGMPVKTDKLTDDQLLYALRFHDPKVQEWARAIFVKKYSLPLSQQPLKPGSEIMVLGHTNFKITQLKKDLKKNNIRYVLKATPQTTHVVLGTGSFVESSMLTISLGYISETVLSEYLREKSTDFLLDSKAEKVSPIAALLTSKIDANIRLALEMLKSGGVPKTLLSELFIASRSAETPALQREARSLLELNANAETRAALRLGLSLKGASKEVVQLFVEGTELDANKIKEWLS